MNVAHEDQRELKDEMARLSERLEELRARLEEPEEIVRAIRSGEVDALVVEDVRGERIYALRSADRLYRSMIEEMQEGAVVLEATGLVVYANAYFAELVRTQRTELVGTSIFPHVPQESRSFFDAVLPPGSAESRKSELVLRAVDGILVPVHATMTRIDVEDGALYCLMVSDLTLERRRAELLAQSRQKDEFLAMLAHELRNPIAPIRNAAQVIRLAHPAEARIVWAREVIERQVQQLSRLVDDLLDVSRITRGRISLELGSVELASTVARAIETVQPLIDARGHDLAITLPNEPLVVTGDSARLAQVVSNLLNNAAKFTPEGGRLSLTLERQANEGRIVVRDNGIGIAPEMLPRIFDLFMQGDSSIERSHGGLGIGLALVRNLVELQGGRVEAKSEGIGKGSEFTLTLPLRDEAGAHAASGPRHDLPAVARRRVLVVDDNTDSAESLTMLLEGLGHDARMVTEGAKVVEAALEFRPELILLDIGLPDVSGFDVARQIRGTPELRDVYLVALTGYSQEEHRRRGAEAGFDRHFVKPIELGALETLLKDLPA